MENVFTSSSCVTEQTISTSTNQNPSINDNNQETASREPSTKQLATIDIFSALTNRLVSSESLYQTGSQLIHFEEFPIQIAEADLPQDSACETLFNFKVSLDDTKECIYRKDCSLNMQGKTERQGTPEQPENGNKDQLAIEDNNMSQKQPSPLDDLSVNAEANKIILDQTLVCQVCNKSFVEKHELEKHLHGHIEDIPFMCEICGQTFSFANSLEDHKRIHLENNTHVCETCDERFALRDDLVSHQMAHSKDFVCSTGKNTLNDRNQLVNHQGIHSDEKLFECETCGKRFKMPRSLLAHKEIHATSGPHVCGTCGEEYTELGKFILHKSTHTGGLFECETCGKQFKTKGHLQTHQSIDADKKPIVCATCGRQFCRLGQLISHQITHTGGVFHCDPCGMRFKKLSHLIKHQEEIHKVCEPMDQSFSGPTQPNRNVCLASNGTSINCKAGRQSFSEVGNVKKNASAHEQKSPVALRTENDSIQPAKHKRLDSTAKKPIICETCGQKFCRLNQLVVHQIVHTGGMFTCDACGRGFRQKSQLRKHQTTYKGKGAHLCDICNKSFCGEKQLVKHKSMHAGEVYECPICKKSFKGKINLEKHKTCHEGERPEECGFVDQSLSGQNADQHKREDSLCRSFACETCGKWFKTKGHLKAHQKIDSDKKPIVCATCGQHFCSLKQFILHEIIHKEVLFDCDTCGKSFKKRSQLKKHLITYKGKDAYVCDICNKLFCGKVQLVIHKTTHNGGVFKCSICGKLFTMKSQLHKHMKCHKIENSEVLELVDQSLSGPNEVVKPERTDVNGKRFACETCGKDFSKNAYLRKHVLTHKRVVSTSGNEIILAARQVANHLSLDAKIASKRCENCGKIFSKISHLKRHLETYKEKDPMICMVCDKSFCAPRIFARHLVEEHGDGLFKCETCGSSFEQKSQLESHQNIDPERKPLKCHACGKLFCQPCDLTAHEIAHNGEVFECENCGEAFTQKVYLNAHQESYEGNHPHLCATCNKPFCELGQLLEHQNVHH